VISLELGIMLTGKGSGISLLIDEVPIYKTKVEKLNLYQQTFTNL
jgi:hypothetical protein